MASARTFRIIAETTRARIGVVMLHKGLALLLVVGCLSTQFWGCNSDNGGTGGTSPTGGDSQAGPVASASMPESAVFPTKESVESGAYTPLSRPLFIYVNKKSLAKPAVHTYVKYYLSDEGQALVPLVGYVSLNAQQLGASRDTLNQAIQEVGFAEPGGEIEGEVGIDGSSTVAPISSAVTEELKRLHPKMRAPVSTSGTSGGFKRFVTGETDISDASRPIKDSEKETCAANGIEYIELKVAIDGLTVVVNKDNNWVDGMTVAQLKRIWEPNSTVKTWADVDPAWPAEPIQLFGPGTDSGTFEYFTEAVCGKARASRTDYTANENDNVLVTGVAGEKYALGYFGYAYYVENQDRLKALAIAP
jgi:phosphate transport system substrate-binding protein